MAGSFLLVEELFERGDAAFERELWRCDDRRLLPFCQRWSRDRRLFARRTLLAMAADPPLAGSARLIVKVLFKAAERQHDDVAMAHFMVGFDRTLQREARLEYRFHPDTNTAGQLWVRGLVGARDPDAFSNRTRAYLMRRAWRYFRRMGQHSPARYLTNMLRALALYDDRHLPRPDSILDTMSLCRALFQESPLLVRDARQLTLKGDLAELTPAPAFAKAWESDVAFEGLLDLLRQAKCAFVRAWVIAYLEREHAARLNKLTLPRLLPLLHAPHDEGQRFAAARLETLSGWGRVGIDTWLELLAIDNAHAVGPLARLLATHVAPERLSHSQCVTLAQSPVAEFATLGLGWLKRRGLDTEEQVAAASSLTEAATPLVRAQAVEWLTPKLAERRHSLLLRDWVDSAHPEVRRAALGVVRDVAHYQDDLLLHSAMAESPYGDVFDLLVQRLEVWQQSLREDDLRHVWATALLAVRRGSRAKQRALSQLARSIAREPAKAAELLPLLGVLLRSVRPPERRGAIAAIAEAVFTNPSLRPSVEAALPELTLWEDSA